MLKIWFFVFPEATDFLEKHNVDCLGEYIARAVHMIILLPIATIKARATASTRQRKLKDQKTPRVKPSDWCETKVMTWDGGSR